MADESLCIRTPRLAGERVRQLLLKLSLLDASQKIASSVETIDIPLAREPDASELKVLRDVAPGAKIVKVESGLLKKTIRPRNVAEVLRYQVGQNLLPHIKHSFDIIGEIAVIEVPPELSSLKELIAHAIIEVHKGVRTVLAKVGAVDGKYRVGNYEHLLGDPETETVHIEHGCRFAVDVGRVFFSPRLSHERMRIAKQVRPGEVIVNMFGGVGIYAIIIAKVCPEVGSVYTVDVNPVAHKLAEENVRMNKCSAKVIPVLSDAREFCMNKVRGVCDRAIMVLPKTGSLFLDAAVAALKEGGEGTINFYAEVAGDNVENDVEAVIKAAGNKIRDCGAERCEVDTWRIASSVGPRRYHVAIDFRIVKRTC